MPSMFTAGNLTGKPLLMSETPEQPACTFSDRGEGTDCDRGPGDRRALLPKGLIPAVRPQRLEVPNRDQKMFQPRSLPIGQAYTFSPVRGAYPATD